MVEKFLKVNKNEIIFAAILIGVLAFVIAVNLGGELLNPISRTNYSGVINFTCNATGIYGPINATVYYNSSGGPIETSATYKMGNTSNWTVFGIAGASVNDENSLNISINTASWPDSSTYNLSCTVCNVTVGTAGGVAHCWNVSGSSTGIYSTTNVSLDNSPPRVENISNPGQAAGFVNGGVYNGSTVLILNISVNDSHWNVYRMDTGLISNEVYFNITNTTENVVNWTAMQNYTGKHYGGWWNKTINFAGFIDGLYNLTIWANESGGGLTNNSEHIQFYIDNTGPSATYTCGPSSVIVGQVVTCVCSGDDSATGSGVNYTTDTTTTSATSQIVTTITTSAAGTFSRTCTVMDRAGNRSSATVSYTVTSPTSSSGGGGDNGGTTSTTGTTITGASTATLSGFEEGTGVKQVEVTVSSSVQNAQVSVTGYDNKPSAVSSSKSGNVYKYMHIEANNFGDNLEKAVIRFKVEKEWVANNGMEKEDVAVFKFDENSADKWNELATTYKEEDAGHYYYDVEVESFSYFAVSEKSLEPSEEPEKTNLLWLWIVIGVVVVAIIVGGGFAVGKKKRR